MTSTSIETSLPPGQRRIDGFPRFGKTLREPPPEVPENPTLRVEGPALTGWVTLPLTELAQLPQAEQVSDFHCVAGWSAFGIAWRGVRFGSFIRSVIEPRLAPGVAATHLRFRGVDGWTSTVLLQDALGDDVLLATGLDGEPLSRKHGAPLRLVSPRQYGYISVKHLVAIEVHPRRPRPAEPFDVITRGHPRARVWKEERHAWVPGRLIRAPYRGIVRLMSPEIARRIGRGEAW